MQLSRDSLRPRHALRPEDGEVALRVSPVIYQHRPLLGSLPERQEQQLQRRFFVGKRTAGFDDPAQRPV